MINLALPALGRLSRNGSETTDARPTDSVVVGTSAAQWQPAPVVYGPDSVFFNLASMRPGKPYPITFEGVELIAVKASDGSVRFYALP
jgi:hypothetical protein